MKTNFANKLFIVFLILTFAATSFAQEPGKVRPFNNKMAAGALNAMNNDVPAIVESSLFVTLQLKDRYPQENYKKIIDRLEDLSQNGKTLAIRYKAGLATIYYKYYDQFKDIKISDKDKENPDLYFKSIAGRIQDNYFVIN
ncbi:MAG: hypothetical protein M1495_12685 [Bacteroidetes bacterium]|nr:hypothetical protein [Bacteroidota bacterium]